jgi:hypothetical protein
MLPPRINSFFEAYQELNVLVIGGTHRYFVPVVVHYNVADFGFECSAI